MSLRGAARTGLVDIRNMTAIEGFKMVGNQKFEEYGIELVAFTHDATGAKYIHVDTEDTNNAFCVGFCTPPTNDTGITHILEHTTLCGSDQYPIKDPFFKMRNRSLSTFMNAMTYPDTTMYPFATINEKDFKNLRSVYLDAVFSPKLDKLDFLQEGHRLEKDEAGDTKIKGVVFNEMKGVYGDPSNLFYHRTIAHLYGRDSCYGHHYGGDPAAITTLTHNDLVEFHRAHYSPANCIIVTYGDLPIVDNLGYINQVLTERAERDNSPGTRKRLQVKGPSVPVPASLTTTGPVDPLMDAEQSGSKICISWALSVPSTACDISFDLAILSNLLTSGPSAPLYQALIEAGVGADFVMGTGFSQEYKGGCFQVGVQGVQLKKHSKEDVEKTIMLCLEDTVKNGFEKKLVESVLHQVELSKAHRSASWGVNVVAALVHNEVHEKPTASAFEATRRVSELREKLKADPAYLQGLLNTHIIQNQHKLVHLMTPEADYPASVVKEEETKQTPDLIASTPAEMVQDKAEFMKQLDRVEDMSILPTLNVESDIPAEPLPDPRIEVLQHPKLEVLQNVLTPTNGVWYFRLVIPISHLSKEELLLLPLMCSLVGQTGAGGYNYRELAQETDLCCSGISAKPVVGTDRKDPTLSRAMLVVTSHGLERCWERFFEILSMMMTDGRLCDEDKQVRLRVKNQIESMAFGDVNSIVDNAHAYALKHAAGQVDKFAACAELIDGISQVAHMKDLMQSVSGDKPEAEARLTDILVSVKALYEKLFAAYPTSRVSLTTTKPVTEEQHLAFNAFIDTLPETDLSPDPSTLSADTTRDVCETGKVFIPAPADLGYIGMAHKTDLSYLHDDMAAVEVMLRIVDTKFLHKEVREKGGAYGAGAVSSVSGNDSVVGMYSYRDPATATTEVTFGKCLEWLETEGNLKDADVNEAKILVFAGADAPKSPQVQGLREFLTTITMEDMRVKRSRLLSVTKEDILCVARKLLDPSWTTVSKNTSEVAFYRTASVVIGGETTWETMKSKDEKWQKWAKLDEVKASSA
eukprot:TRINITY_DN11244_c0_g1_i1.p1 TRINITY_DN11244_c0_g1~~TRINITY_DN11244_c0_g1_i1.p1  ORF type:complete len:1050 (+),score=289.42 TRINITY_DN11244_c0_g1_i1:47-3151(+)